ncbi:hypothetical protein Sulac_2078 [Sulfobacillus acidophilus DSM 10332]|uniref:Uncharacterized protein n=1 Tax=Sulfobacillus acidophilus (strain ATCC 700253 / DSM 10332 / NAL) TaxID=679936 RepID=G8TSV1_SULAD|nr:hypothetical protein Sulac_2078 [Sulfobacillus acidophilus DSM 10332]
MTARRYYSIRTGKDQGKVILTLELLRKLFYGTYMMFDSKEYFQEALGYDCVDAGKVPGLMGTDPETYAMVKLRKHGLFPIKPDFSYSENDIFDLIEFLYDYISKPIDGYFHNYCNCGWHYSTFDKKAGQEEFREAVNEFLTDYQDGWELSSNGEILSKGQPGLHYLFNASLPLSDEENVNGRVDAAIRKFRRHHSSIEDRRDAVRDLAAVLEYLRPQAQAVITKKDESDLFELANRFGIRHHNQKQKTDYDQNIWLSWAFYYYLATIHALLHLTARKTGNPRTE